MLFFVPDFIIGGGNDVLYAFDKLKEMPGSNMPKPFFAFVHILAPHYDYNLDPNCGIIPIQENGKKGYIDKLLCVNKKTVEAVDELLAKSTMPPIIIFKSDHGEGSTEDVAKYGISAVTAQNKIKNFTALYLPDGGIKVIPPDLTPVNMFRLIFNYYFGANYELLEDKSYFVCEVGCPSSKGDIRFLFDVTEETKF